MGADDADLERWLTGRDGHCHHNSLPLGGASEDVLAEISVLTAGLRKASNLAANDNFLNEGLLRCLDQLGHAGMHLAAGACAQLCYGLFCRAAKRARDKHRVPSRPVVHGLRQHKTSAHP